MTVNIGSAGKGFQLLIDTGSSDLIVAATNCPKTECTNQNTLGSEDSNTLTVTPATWSEGYKSPDTYASGNVVEDIVSIFGANIGKMSFGAATSASGYIFSYVHAVIDLAYAG